MVTETRELQSELGSELRQAIDLFCETASRLASQLPSEEFLTECNRRLGTLLRACDSQLSLLSAVATESCEPDISEETIAFPVTCVDGAFELRLAFNLHGLSESAKAELLHSVTTIMGDLVCLTSMSHCDQTAATQDESDLGLNLVSLSRHDWQVKRVTASATRRFGIKPGVLFCEDVTSNDYRQCLRDFLQEAAEQRSSERKRFKMRWGQDDQLDVEINVIDGYNGELVCALNLANDISRSNEYIPPAESERLVHRLRNPLTTILSCCSQLLDSPQSEGSVDRNTLINWIDSAAEAQNRTIDRYLMLYGPARASVQLINLSKFVAAVVSEFESNSGRKLQTALPADYLQVNIDPYLGRQMLMEILQNAQEVEREGPIDLLTVVNEHRVSIGIRNKTNEPHNDFARHFAEPFYTTKPSHAGLGLAIARRYASIFGGGLRLIAEPEATVISVELPLAPQTTSNPHPERT